MQATQIFVLIYLIFYGCWSSVGIYDNFKSQYKRWISVLDVIISVISFFGILIFYLHAANVLIVNIWRLVFFIIVAWEVWFSQFEFKYLLEHPDPDDTQEETVKLARIGFCVYGILVMPCIIINYMLAFG